MEWYFSSMQAADRLDILASEAMQYSTEANELPVSSRRFWTGAAAISASELLQRYADNVSMLPKQIYELADAIRDKAIQLETEAQQRALEEQTERLEGGTGNE